MLDLIIGCQIEISCYVTLETLCCTDEPNVGHFISTSAPGASLLWNNRIISVSKRIFSNEVEDKVNPNWSHY